MGKSAGKAGISTLARGPASDKPVLIAYEVNMKMPKTSLAAQGFRLNNEDVTYIFNLWQSNIRGFGQVIVSTVRPIGTLKNVTTGR